MMRFIAVVLSLLAFACPAVCGADAPSFVRASPVWPVGSAGQMNGFVCFKTDFDWTEGACPVLRLTGSSVYRVKLNGAFLGYGPARAAKGWFRVDEWPLASARKGENRLEIEVSAYNCSNFYIPKGPGFLQAEVVVDNTVLAATPSDFKAFDTGRIQTVSRYSFQRGFSEAYRLPHVSCELPLEVRPSVRLLERIASYPEFKVIRDYRPVVETDVRWATNLQYRANRFIDKVDNVKIDGYAKDTLEFNGWEAVWKWQVVGKRPASGTRFALSSGKGVVFASPVNRCGFFGFHVKAKTQVRLFALFDEFADGDAVDATRAISANSVRWDLAPGEYDLEAFEPYMSAGLHLLVDTGDAEIGMPYLREYASPDATAECPTDDPVLKSVFEAARESFRANAVDVFTDCPGRERAGWLCDSFFTGRSSYLFTGSTKLERLFLQNYLLPDRLEHLPEGMLPMCYPSDHADGVYIPNWTFWLVLELEEYLQRSGDRELIDAFKPKMMALLRFFEKYENADGLLEKLPSWVFVEWSKANELVQDVNYPSNATWASALDALARLYAMPELADKARRIRERIREQAWNGAWFADNAVRQADGSLRRGDICTEVCQYYLFLFGVATPESHPDLWRRLVDEFGPDRRQTKLYPDIPFAEEFIGSYLRLEMLSRAGLGDRVLAEMGGFFKKMADKTGTLWELSKESSSKNHGFASYAACWIAKHASRGLSKVSPDGKNRIDYRNGCVTVSREGRVLFGPQPVALKLDRGEAAVELFARDDGVAYRFVTDVEGDVTVVDETCSLVFPSADTEIWVGYNWCDNPKDPKQDKLQHGCASIYTKTTPGAFVPDGRRIAYLPMTVRYEDGTTVLFSESDLRDYAGLHLRRDGRETRRLDGVFGKHPVREREWTAPRHYRRVREREDWIVLTSGRRTFPWRVFAIASSPIGLTEQRLVRDLAAPPQGDYSWVRPGLATWEWWNKWHLEDVPFVPGVNTETYKAYIDFAAEYGLGWLLVDEGWKDGDDLYKTVPAFDLDEIVGFAAARKVQVMLWTSWRALDGRQEEYFSAFAKRGVKGFKIDFMERDDAEMMRFMEDTLKIAAKYRLCIDFHGCGKPTGLERTYPNLIGIEGVHGLELMKLGFAKDDDFPSHDCQVVFTRAPLGMVDYTPGAMMNRRRTEWRPDDANPASQGTRVHQMALYTLFPVPFQMLCDSPSRYRKNPECTRFLADMPTVWDETRGLAGEIGKFAAVARRKDSDWWVGAITDWSARKIDIDTSFLGDGDWTAEIFADAETDGACPEGWTRTIRQVRSGESLCVELAPGGGWTARFSPVGERGIFLEGETPEAVAAGGRRRMASGGLESPAAAEPGTLTNRFLRVTAAAGEFEAFRWGEAEPFARWSADGEDSDMCVRLDDAHPFVYVDVAPRAVLTNRLAGVLTLPELTLRVFEKQPVRQGSAGLEPVDGNLPSCGYLAIAAPVTRQGVVAGWLTNFRASGAFTSRTDAKTGRIVIGPIADYGRMQVKVGRQHSFDTFVIGAFDDCRLGLEAYADAVADRFAIRLKPNRTGYCTWCSDRYGASDRSQFPEGCGAGTETSVRRLAAVAAEKLAPYGFEFVQIDDQWQGGGVRNGPAKDWSRPRPQGPYSNGFKSVVKSLNAVGLAAGLWFIPFGADAAASFWKDRDDLYVKSAVTVPERHGTNAYEEPVVLPRKAGGPVKTLWGGECLDMTNPEARDKLSATVRRFTADWGFRYLKCDGLFTGLGCDIYGGYSWQDVNFANAVFADPDASNVSAFRLGLETIRRAATPDTFVLGCNLGTIRAMVPSFGLVDGMRIGNDNGPIGEDPMKYLEGPKAGSMRYFFNGRVWRADPDSTYVRAALPIGRARLGACWTAISDSLFEVGDWVPDLPDERLEILRRTMAHHGVKQVRPVDYFERSLPRIWVLDGGERKVVALFNWSTNETFSVDCDFGYIGLDPEKTYVGYDFWGKRPINPFRHRFRATVPPDDCRILSCCAVKEDEIVISTSLHVAAPVYGVENGRVLTIRGEPLEVRTYSPVSGHRSFLIEPGSGGWRDIPVGSLRSQTVSKDG